MKKHLEEVLQTIKLIDIEERFDIYFSRFLGLYFAKIGLWLKATPTHVSLVSLIIGLIGGGLLYFQDDLAITFTAGILISLAGVLDSADGQLARMSQQSTDLGRIIDGVIDNFVFVSCYLGALFYFYPIYGWPYILIAALAGLAHSSKSAIYEFYKSEYLFFATGNMSSKIMEADELKRTMKRETWIEKALYIVYLDYTKRQFSLSSRSMDLRNRFEELTLDDTTKIDFRKQYRKLNKPNMFWWALVCGSNTHRSLIMIMSLFGRFDIYLVIAIVTYLPVMFIEKRQKRTDDKLLSRYD